MELKPCPFCESFAKSIRDAAVLAGICREDIPLTGPQLLMLCEDMGQILKNTRATDSLLKEMAEAFEVIIRCLSHGLQDCKASITAKAILQKYHEQVGE